MPARCSRDVDTDVGGTRYSRDVARDVAEIPRRSTSQALPPQGVCTSDATMRRCGSHAPVSSSPPPSHAPTPTTDVRRASRSNRSPRRREIARRSREIRSTCAPSGDSNAFSRAVRCEGPRVHSALRDEQRRHEGALLPARAEGDEARRIAPDAARRLRRIRDLARARRVVIQS